MRRAFVNGKCHIKAGSREAVHTLVVEDNIVLDYGDPKILEKYPDAEVIDLCGKTLLPGFNDSHMHMLNYAFCKNTINLESCTSKTHAKAKIASEIASKGLAPGSWVDIIGWNQDNWTDGTILTKEDLDEVTPNNPAYAVRICGHTCILNTLAMKEIGLTKDTPQPKDGYFLVDENGNPTGYLAEMLPFIFSRMKEPTVEEIKELLREGCKDANALGITSIQTDDFDAMPGSTFKNVIEAYRELATEGRLTLRVNEQCSLLTKARYEDFLDAGYAIGQGDEKFKLGCVKLFLDGSLGARSAWLQEPYSDDESTVGFATFSNEQELFDLVKRTHLSGADVAMHCIGDGAADQGMRAVENAIKEDPDFAHRHGLVHAQILSKDICQRMSDFSVMAYIQPIFLEYDLHIAENRVGSQRIVWSYNWRTLKNLGIKLGMGTDCPVESFNPLPNIYSAVTRKDLELWPEGGWHKEQALTLEEALEGYTETPAYMSREEAVKGTLEKGMIADMVVLDEDIYEVDSDKIKDISVVMTIVGGEIVYKV